MTSDMLEALERRIAQEIERLRTRHAVLLRELPRCRELATRWVLEPGWLRWFVAFDEEVLEPDIDVEIAGELVVVRARPLSDDELTLLGLLPVPPGFDSAEPAIIYTEGALEIRVRRVGEGGAAT